MTTNHVASQQHFRAFLADNEASALYVQGSPKNLIKDFGKLDETQIYCFQYKGSEATLRDLAKWVKTDSNILEQEVTQCVLEQAQSK